MMNQKVTAFVLSAAMAAALTVPAYAADGGNDVALCPSPEPVSQSDLAAETDPQAPDSVLYYGQVTEIQTDDAGAVTALHLRSDRYGEYVMLVSEDTVWIDSGNYAASSPEDLEVGESVYVFHSSVSTRSLPPQSQAYAVVRNIPQDVGAGQYATIGEIAENSDGTYQILTADGSMYLTVGSDTVLSAYAAGTTFQLSDLEAGDRIVAWYDIALLSYPGQAYAHHLMLLPEETAAPSEGDAVALELDGTAAEVTGRYENGTVMVPVAAVAEALGFDVTYTREGSQAPEITVESDDFRVQMTIGSNLVTGVTKIPGAVGMTAPQDYGMAPYIVEPGTTWTPAQLFEMLGKTVTLEGTLLSIQ